MLSCLGGGSRGVCVCVCVCVCLASVISFSWPPSPMAPRVRGGDVHEAGDLRVVLDLPAPGPADHQALPGAPRLFFFRFPSPIIFVRPEWNWGRRMPLAARKTYSLLVQSPSIFSSAWKGRLRGFLFSESDHSPPPWNWGRRTKTTGELGLKAKSPGWF